MVIITLFGRNVVVVTPHRNDNDSAVRVGVTAARAYTPRSTAAYLTRAPEVHTVHSRTH